MGQSLCHPFGWVPGMSYPEESIITCLCYHLSSRVWTSVLQHSLRFGDRIVARSWRVVTPTIGLVALMVTMPKELLWLRPIS